MNLAASFSNSPSLFSRRFLAAGSALALATAAFPARAEVSFNRDIRPLLSDRCFQCHGPDEHERKANLRLDEAGGDEGAYREVDGLAAIKPGHPDESAVMERILSHDPDDVMPPPSAKKRALTRSEIDLIRQWIADGAVYEEFWAFRKPGKPTPPEVANATWSKQPIDRFILRKLEAEGRQPSPKADRRTLIRRLALDLTGLPPTPAQIQSFLSDTGAEAYVNLVDRLLEDEAYGEHMTKYWLDLVRFADTNGIHHDHYRDLTPYRDWVIRSFNANLPYDDFVRYQLAGDLYSDPSRDQLIASGFHRLHLIIDVGTALPEESHTRNVIDRVTSVGTAFMGLTVQCAVCHDHKYDPITAKDFYQLYAFFNNIDAQPETGRRSGSDFLRGLQPPYINLTTPEQESSLRDFENRIKAGEDEIARLKQKGDPAEKLKEVERRLGTLREEEKALLMQIPAAMVMKEREEIRPAHILTRGAYDQPGEQVERGTPGFLPPMRPSESPTKSRMDLAEWMVSPDNPLTARVAINRFWQQLFGIGLVKTAEDFGNQGEWPSHPELLDYLASSFMGSGWNIKALLREIVLSETYQQEANATPEQFEEDPDNRLLARGSRYRMDSEMIRDQVLASSGLLNREMFGKSVKPPQPAGLWLSVGMPSSYPKEYEPDDGERIYRRSLYTFWKRGMPPPQMTILNAPTREACIARRERTNTPLQALLLMNEQEYLKAARHLAHESLRRAPQTTPNERVAQLYERITSHFPSPTESAPFLDAYQDLRELYREKPMLAQKLCEGLELSANMSNAELSAWTLVTSAIYNLDVTKTRQ